MAKKLKRDNAYYEGRLKKDYPTIHADLVAGKYRTITEAAIAAGLKKQRTRLHELKNAWTHASSSEKRAFLSWMKITAGGLARSNSPVHPPVTADGFIEPWAKTRIYKIMTTRGISVRTIRDEMGVSSFDTSLESALQTSGTKIRKQALITALEKWLAANSSV